MTSDPERGERNHLGAWFRTGLSLFAVGMLVTCTRLRSPTLTTHTAALAWLGIAMAATGVVSTIAPLLWPTPRRCARPSVSLPLLLACFVALIGAVLVILLLLASC